MTKVIAHRGYSSLYLENSPAAWQAAVEAGADFVELDIRFTADGVAVCCHDATLERLAGRAEAVAQLSHGQIKQLRASHPGLAPDLATAFDVISPSCGVLLDVKDERPEAVERLDRLLKAFTRSNVVLGLHHPASVSSMVAQGHEKILALMLSVEHMAAFASAGASIVRLWQSDATPERLSSLAELQMPVWITTGGKETGRKVGDFHPPEIIHLAGMGAEGFLVNDPAVARSALDRIGSVS